MVQGPCRGSNCDFWARVKLKKSTVDELAQQAVCGITRCSGSQDSITSVIDCFWRSFGLKSMKRLRKEEPGLFEKVAEVSRKLESLLRLDTDCQTIVQDV